MTDKTFNDILQIIDNLFSLKISADNLIENLQVIDRELHDIADLKMLADDDEGNLKNKIRALHEKIQSMIQILLKTSPVLSSELLITLCGIYLNYGKIIKQIAPDERETSRFNIAYGYLKAYAVQNSLGTYYAMKQNPDFLTLLMKYHETKFGSKVLDAHSDFILGLEYEVIGHIPDKYDMIIYTDFDDTLIAKAVGMTNNGSVEPTKGAFFPPAQAFLARQLSNNERSFHIKVISTGGDAAHEIRPLFITAFGEETVQALEARDALSFLGPSEINAYYSDRELPDDEIKAQIINEHRSRGESAIYLDDHPTYFCVMMSRYARNQPRGFCMPILVPKIQAPLRDIELPNFHHFHLADLMTQGYIYPEQTFLQLRAYATEYLHAENHPNFSCLGAGTPKRFFVLMLLIKHNLIVYVRRGRLYLTKHR